MKIAAIRISGFRGIPPIDPPQVSLPLQDRSGPPQNLVLFGPNAFGKSSIADAIEWFFKERVRGSEYFDGFSDSDTVHINVGKPGFPQKAFVELDILHNGQVCTVRKELDQTGRKCGESLGAIAQDLAAIQDEIVVLDHDQFREFVTAASKDKWQTFSSLIGYEMLDQFRAGMESLIGKALSDRFRLTEQERSLKQGQQRWNSSLRQTLAQYDIPYSGVDDLATLCQEFVSRLEVVLLSLGLEVPKTIDDINDAYWTQLRLRARPTAAYSDAKVRIANLEREANSLTPLSNTFVADVRRFVWDSVHLASQKDQFDKHVLVDFYKLGIRVISETKAIQDKCPLCDSNFGWNLLLSHVQDKLSTLDFEGIEQKRQDLEDQLQALGHVISSRRSQLRNHIISEVKQAFAEVDILDTVSQAISITSFDAGIIEDWARHCECLAQVMVENEARLQDEANRMRANLGENAQAQIAGRIDDLDHMWRAIRNLADEQERLRVLKRKHDVTDEVVSGLRKAATSFRAELSDFSGQVVELINENVNKYYRVLHPDDHVRPFLKVSISGTQRTVNLLCDYHGSSGRDAASLLSESHRNSLGLAILLAFANYKRRVGSPVEFCVLDDVTQSFDTSHRVNLLNLLEDGRFPEISGQQVILLTHDRTLADLIKRPGEERHRENWIRMDIRNWWLQCILLEPCQDPVQRAQWHINHGDEVAAAVYARRALEEVYKSVLAKCRVRVWYNPKPWTDDLDTYRELILSELQELWDHNEGFIDPTDVNVKRLFTCQRILNLTVHDSAFLENPMTIDDVKAALAMIDELTRLFKCRSCGRNWLPTLRKQDNGKLPICKGCHKPVII